MVKATPTELKFYEEDGGIGLDATFDLKAPCFPGDEQLVVVYVHPEATRHVGKDVMKLRATPGMAYAMAVEGLVDVIKHAIVDSCGVFIDDLYISYAYEKPSTYMQYGVKGPFNALSMMNMFDELKFPDPLCLSQQVPETLEPCDYFDLPLPEPVAEEPTPWSLVFDN